MDCPKGHGWQPIVLNMTVDGQGATQPGEILAQRLGCGCVVGGEDYNAFMKQRDALNVAAYKAKQAIDDAAKAKVAALWTGIVAAKEAVKNGTP
jgi:hypothetical protein